MAEVRTAILVVSHSEPLARGTIELASQMAPGVTLRAAGGTDDGRLGTSIRKVGAELDDLTARFDGVLVLTDIGSATMTVETVLELRGAERVALADAPIVEGTIAAAVAAESGAPIGVAHHDAEQAALSFRAASAPREA